MYQNNGFTLIEMLLVLSIIITLSTLAFPYMKNKRHISVMKVFKNKY